MRLLRTFTGNCHAHPSATKQGRPNGAILCSVCGIKVGQWNLPWRPLWAVRAENLLGRMVAWALPRSVVTGALKRAIAHATQARWGDSSVHTPGTITAQDLALRWELETPAASLPAPPEWVRGYL